MKKFLIAFLISTSILAMEEKIRQPESSIQKATFTVPVRIFIASLLTDTLPPLIFLVQPTGLQLKSHILETVFNYVKANPTLCSARLNQSAGWIKENPLNRIFFKSSTAPYISNIEVSQFTKDMIDQVTTFPEIWDTIDLYISFGQRLNLRI